jgi:hypothetical protein
VAESRIRKKPSLVDLKGLKKLQTMLMKYAETLELMAPEVGELEEKEGAPAN